MGPDHRNADGMLLYGKTAHEDRDLDEMMQVQGHRIRIVTLDLGQPWEKIEERLTSLVDLGWAPGSATSAPREPSGDDGRPLQ
jgi:hypothetical protein